MKKIFLLVCMVFSLCTSIHSALVSPAGLFWIRKITNKRHSAISVGELFLKKGKLNTSIIGSPIPAGKTKDIHWNLPLRQIGYGEWKLEVVNICINDVNGNTLLKAILKNCQNQITTALQSHIYEIDSIFGNPESFKKVIVDLVVEQDISKSSMQVVAK